MEHQRLCNWWISWEDFNWPQPHIIDRIKRKADAFAEANITTAIIFGGHFRWDYMPFFTLFHDYLGTVAEELHERGLKLYDHHSVNLVHRYDTREQMRHVMLHSGPHIPFCPSSEAAKTWEYNGKKLNDWRQVDVKTGQPVYFPQYYGEGFCHRNPEFQQAYQEYANQLIRDTNIDGLMADDAMYFMRYNVCGCEHCRAELKKRSGIDLPPIEDQSFWGNWENPAWRDWIDLRFDATGDFYENLRKALPENFPLCNCGGSSASDFANNNATDARQFLRGGNFVNLEHSGNTPPYTDPKTNNRPMAFKMIMASHHQAAAKEKGVRCYGTTYGFTEPSANICWALNKTLDADCHFSTLKRRLGLPQDILDSLPEETDAIKRAYTYEKEHPELFHGESVGQVGVYFSYETRNHTCFGGMTTGYAKDYKATLEKLFRAGISAHTVFSFRQDPKEYPVILVPSAASMTEEETAQMRQYLKKGGKLIVTGPSAIRECKNTWVLPTCADTAPKDFFDWFDLQAHLPGWMAKPIPVTSDPDSWQTMDGIFYNPHRMEEPSVAEEVLGLCRKYMKQLPVDVVESEGYFVTMFEDGDQYNVHFLAAEYDTDIDHHLDEIRFHRSRVNYINKVEPVGISRTIRIASDTAPQVFTPFCREESKVEQKDGMVTITLPEKCAYAVVRF